MYTIQEIENASNVLGSNLMSMSKRRQNMLITIYHYNEGWINELECEKRLSKIFNNPKK